MTLVSPEFCRTLHELSGWGDTEKRYHHGKAFTPVSYGSGPANITPFDDTYFPAYDLGYLLRKLRADFAVKETGFEMYVDGTGTDSKIRNEVRFRCSDDFRVSADTPEDAAAKLCIELFKQGILKPTR